MLLHMIIIGSFFYALRMCKKITPQAPRYICYFAVVLIFSFILGVLHQPNQHDKYGIPVQSASLQSRVQAMKALTTQSTPIPTKTETVIFNDVSLTVPYPENFELIPVQYKTQDKYFQPAIIFGDVGEAYACAYKLYFLKDKSGDSREAFDKYRKGLAARLPKTMSETMAMYSNTTVLSCDIPEIIENNLQYFTNSQAIQVPENGRTIREYSLFSYFIVKDQIIELRIVSRNELSITEDLVKRRAVSGLLSWRDAILAANR